MSHKSQLSETKDSFYSPLEAPLRRELPAQMLNTTKLEFTREEVHEQISQTRRESNTFINSLLEELGGSYQKVRLLKDKYQGEIEQLTVNLRCSINKLQKCEAELALTKEYAENIQNNYYTKIKKIIADQQQKDEAARTAITKLEEQKEFLVGENQELKKLTKEIPALKSKIETSTALREEHATLQKEHQGLIKLIEEYQAQIEASAQANALLKEQSHVLSKNFKKSRAINAELTVKITETEKQILALQEDKYQLRNKHSAQLTSAQTDNQQLKTKLNQFTTKCAYIEQLIAAQDERQCSSTDAANQVSLQLIKSSFQQEELKKKVQDLESQLEKARQSKISQSGKIGQLVQDMKGRYTKRERLLRKDCARKVKGLKEELKQFRRQIEKELSRGLKKVNQDLINLVLI